MKKIKIPLYRLASLTVILMMISCSSDQNHQNISTNLENGIIISKKQYDQAGMETGILEEKLFTKSVHCNGYIMPHPSDIAKLSSPISGIVEKINFVHNQHVTKGQVLLVIDGPDFIRLQQSYFEAKAKYLYAKESYDRGQLLFNENVKSKKEISILESDYLSSKSLFNSYSLQLKQLGVNLDKTEDGNYFETFDLKAPISGYIVKSNVVIGESFNSNEELLEIINPDDLYIEMEVFESDITKLKQGMDIIYNLVGEVENVFNGKLISVGNLIDQETKTITCIGSIDNDELRIAGVFVDAEILTSVHQGLGLPNEAIIKSGNDFFVFTISEKSADEYLVKPQQVERGSSFKGYTEILSPPLDTKKIILRGAFQLPIDF